MHTGEYYNQQEEQSEIMARRRKIRAIDLGTNWAAVALISFIGFWILLTDIGTYQSEKIFHRMINDGITVDELQDPYMKRGMERNQQYRGTSETEFFIAKWKWRFAIYLAAIGLPLIVASIRAFRYDHFRANWLYFFLVGLSIAYAIYFYGKFSHLW